MIRSSQIPLPDNTQHSQQTDIHAPGRIRTHDLSRRSGRRPTPQTARQLGPALNEPFKVQNTGRVSWLEWKGLTKWWVSVVSVELVTKCMLEGTWRLGKMQELVTKAMRFHFNPSRLQAHFLLAVQWWFILFLLVFLCPSPAIICSFECSVFLLAFLRNHGFATYNKKKLGALISQIYFWNKTLHLSDNSSVHHQEFFTVHTAMVYFIYVCWLLASRIRTGRPDPARKLSANIYEIYHCCVYSEKLLMMDRGIVRNM